MAKNIEYGGLTILLSEKLVSFSILCAILSSTLMPRQYYVGYAFVCISLVSFLAFCIFYKKDDSSESSKLFRQESEAQKEENFNDIEMRFVNDLMEYAYSIGVKARVISENGVLKLQHEIETDKFEDIRTMFIPREAKSVMSTEYKRAFNDMQSSIDEVKERLEEAKK